MKFSKRFYNNKENTEALKISNNINNNFVKHISETKSKSQIIINSNLKNESYEYNTLNKNKNNNKEIKNKSINNKNESGYYNLNLIFIF